MGNYERGPEPTNTNNATVGTNSNENEAIQVLKNGESHNGRSPIFVCSELSFKECVELEQKFDYVVRVDGENGKVSSKSLQRNQVSKPNSSLIKNMENEPIAIIGLSCRLPGASDASIFWSNLLEKVDSMTTVPDGRWTSSNGCTITPAHSSTLAGFLSTPIDTFDASFFPISPAELSYTDPQARLLLQLSWECLEDAKILPSTLHGSNAAFYIGLWRDEYKSLLEESASLNANEELRRYLGNSLGNSAARLAHTYGTIGPSFAIETGCSSSICSIGAAMSALRRGETDLALAGGVNLLLKPFVYDSFQGVLSPSGHCKPFQEDADGFARAEGCILYAMKRLKDAVKDGDRIHCVLRGYGSSQEGLSRSVGTPTMEGEAIAMKMALKNASIHPHLVDWVECHGTGTRVGDPIEVDATRTAYNAQERKRPLIISSVKGNIGHTESVSGAASLLKVILALKNDTIPPQRLVGNINPRLNMEGLQIPTEKIKWEHTKGKNRVAAISSFGITGTNAHLIVEAGPQPLPHNNGIKSSNVQSHYILPISAKNPSALQQLILTHVALLEKNEDICLENYCATVSQFRTHFPQHRTAFVASSREELISSLKSGAGFEPEPELQLPSRSNKKKTPKLCFLFPGQGCQYDGMGKTLYTACPLFRRHFQVVANLLEEGYNIDLKTLLFQGTQVSLYSQLCIFAVEYCLLKLWASWGIKPDLVVGHSFGEFAASCAAGALALPTALELLVAMRTKMFAQVEGGSMLVIRANEKETEALIKEFVNGRPKLIENNNEENIWVDIAAVNAPDQTVTSGSPTTIGDFQTFLTKKNVKTSTVNVTHAFHSRSLDQIGERFEQEAKTLKYSKRFPEVAYISSVHGRVMEADETLDGPYWRKHMRQSVQFVEASKIAVKEGEGRIFLEVGPHPLLSPLVKKNNPDTPVLCIPSMRKGADEVQTVMEALAQLYVNGMDDIKWGNVWESFEVQGIKDCPIPTYQFQHGESYWFTPAWDERRGLGQSFDNCIENSETPNVHPLLGKRVPLPIPNMKIYSTSTCNILTQNFTWIKDHKIGTNIIFPAAGWVEMAIAAAILNKSIKTKEFKSCQIQDFEVKTALPLYEGGESVNVMTVIDEDGKVSFHSRQGQDWKIHASAKVVIIKGSGDSNAINPSFKEILKNHQDSKELSEIYPKMKTLGYNFDKSFQTLRKMGNDENNLDFDIYKITTSCENGEFSLHPTLIDALIQAAILSSDELNELKLPTRISNFVINFGSTGNNEKNQFIKAGKDGASLHAENGDVLACLKNLTTVATTLRKFEMVAGLCKKNGENVLLPLYIDEWVASEINICDADVKVTVDKEYFNRFTNTLKLTLEQKQEFEGIEKFVRLSILQSLVQLGWKGRKGEKFYAKELMKSLSINDATNPKFFRRLLALIEEEGFIQLLDKSIGHYKIIQDLNAPLNVKIPVAKHFTEEHSFALFYASKLTPIVTGTESVLTHLFPKVDAKFSAAQLYSTFTQSTSLVDSLSSVFLHLINLHKASKTHLRVLEVGAGTGSVSKHLLQHLENAGINYTYTFTDVSPTFLTKAENETLSAFGNKVEYKLLDLEKDPFTQEGFAKGTEFHVIVANNVLHATASLVETVTNLRKLLSSSNGHLLVGEQLKPTALVDIIFGHCEGYWRFKGEEGRKEHCLLGKEEWISNLNSAGYLNPFVIESQDVGMGVIVASNNLNVDTKVKTLHTEWTLISTNTKFMAILDNNLTQQLNATKVSHYNMQPIAITDTDLQIEGNIIFHLSRLTSLNSEENLSIFLKLAQMICKDPKKFGKVYIISENVASISDECEESSLNSWPVLGLCRTLQTECPSISIKWVDLDSSIEMETSISQIMSELKNFKETEKASDQIAYRGGSRYVSKLVEIEPTSPLQRVPEINEMMTEAYIQLRLPSSRSIQDVEWESAVNPKQAHELAPHEVQVRVFCSGLNFKDLLNVMKPTQEFFNACAVGADLCGEIIRIGSSVSGLKVGDAVIGMNLKPQPLPSHVIMESSSVARLPSSMSWAEGATLPTAFLTAYHCLVDVAHLEKGERVLIHTGSGAVGLAAIQIAKQLGAQVITTAGSNRKRNFLRNSMGISSSHIFNSRDFFSYKEGVARVTSGKGVAVVLNSLTSRGFKEASLSCLQKEGRFIEMSKLNIWTSTEVAELRPDVQYNIEDLSLPLKERHAHLTSKLEEWLSSEKIRPLRLTQFNREGIVNALTYLERAQHIGKVVVRMSPFQFDERSSYLITGGTGGIGLHVLRWMLSQGASHVVLCSRSGLCDLSPLKEEGLDISNVLIKKADVSQKQDVLKLLQTLSGPPLRGIIHAAGTLSDGILLNQTDSKFASVFAPKAMGALNLHTAASELSLPLEHFVLFSSAMWVLGGPGQGNYSAANAYLQGLGELRHRLGLPCTVIHWGHWGTAGMGGDAKNIFGMTPFSTERGIKSLHHIMSSPGLLRNVMAAELNTEDLKGTEWLRDWASEEVLAGCLVPVSSEQGTDPSPSSSSIILNKGEKVRELVARILRIKGHSLEGSRELREMGMDSLMFIELKNKLQHVFHTAIELSDNTTLDDVVAIVENN